MKRGSTHFLRFTTFMLGLVVLAICVFGLPNIYQGASAEFTGTALSNLVIVALLYASALPFFFALWQTFKLLSYIDKNTAFSDLTVKALRNIKYSAIAMTVLYFACVPFLIPIAEIDDAPGLIPIGAAFACIPLVVAVFAAVLQRLLQSAIDIKSENDLTV